MYIYGTKIYKSRSIFTNLSSNKNRNSVGQNLGAGNDLPLLAGFTVQFLLAGLKPQKVTKPSGNMYVSLVHHRKSHRKMGHLQENHGKMEVYPLVNVYITMEHLHL